MKKIYSLLVLPALFFVNACDEEAFQRVTGEGKVESITATVEDFSSVELEHVANVYITTGQEKKVVFTAYENILPYMQAVVMGDQLILRFNRNITVNTDEEIRIDISVPSVEEISLEGVGNFYLNGPSQNSLKINLDGVGNVESYGLPVLNGDVDIDGTGSVEVDAEETLKVDIDGLGNVYYKGTPQLTIDINGLGEVIRD
jgi:hypothetical protein